MCMSSSRAEGRRLCPVPRRAVHGDVQRLQRSDEYDRKQLKCLGELNEKELVELVNGMMGTAERGAEEDEANEIEGSHGDLPP